MKLSTSIFNRMPLHEGAAEQSSWGAEKQKPTLDKYNWEMMPQMATFYYRKVVIKDHKNCLRIGIQPRTPEFEKTEAEGWK